MKSLPFLQELVIINSNKSRMYLYGFLQHFKQTEFRYVYIFAMDYVKLSLFLFFKILFQVSPYFHLEMFSFRSTRAFFEIPRAV